MSGLAGELSVAEAIAVLAMTRRLPLLPSHGRLERTLGAALIVDLVVERRIAFYERALGALRGPVPQDHLLAELLYAVQEDALQSPGRRWPAAVVANLGPLDKALKLRLRARDLLDDDDRPYKPLVERLRVEAAEAVKASDWDDAMASLLALLKAGGLLGRLPRSVRRRARKVAVELAQSHRMGPLLVELDYGINPAPLGMGEGGGSFGEVDSEVYEAD